MVEGIEDEILHRIVAEHGRQRDSRAGGAEMRGDDGRPADEVLPPVEPHARRRRFGHAADHRGMRQTVDDRVTDNVNRDTAEIIEDGAQPLEGDAFGLHQHQQLVDRYIRRARFDQRRR